MRDWLSDPPDGVTVREDLDGVTLTCSNARLGLKIGVEVFTVLFLAGVLLPGGLVLGIWLWLPVMRSDTMWMAAVGVLGAFVTTLLAVLIGPVTLSLLRTRAGGHRETRVTIGAHTIHLDGESVSLSEVQFVTGDAEPELVLRGGRRAAIVPGAAEAHRRWLAVQLSALVRQRSEGSEEDIPEALHQLKRPGQPIRSG